MTIPGAPRKGKETCGPACTLHAEPCPDNSLRSWRLRTILAFGSERFLAEAVVLEEDNTACTFSGPSARRFKGWKRRRS